MEKKMIEFRKIFKGLASAPYKVGYSWIILYHGGAAKLEEESFDFSNEKQKPEELIISVDWHTPTGVYYVRRGLSNPRNLETWRIQVLRDNDKETAKIRQRVEDSLKKDPSKLAAALAVI